jgi:uncharacterized protein with von Willebrand factor type A (vWA) domain
MTNPDLATELTGLARRLREMGVAVDPSRIMTGVHALTRFDPPSLENLYWSTRLAFCSHVDDITRFDAAFNGWFATSTVGGSVRADPTSALPATIGEGDADGPTGRAQVALAAGAAELLAARNVATLTPAERAEVTALIGLLRPYTGRNRSPRWSPGGRTQVDLARTVRQLMRGHGELDRLRYRRHLRRPRRLVVLLDVSESMAPYRDALLRFAHAAVRVRPTRTETFALTPRPTRLTLALSTRDPQAAIGAVTGMTPDWGGGTELGRGLRQFLREWGASSSLRSAVVVLASDGWERDPILLRQQMGRLRRLAYYLVWVNPQAGWENFRPKARGLRENLSLVDRHVAGDSFAALRSLATLIASV